MPRKVKHMNIETYAQEGATIPAAVIVVEGTADGQAKLPAAADAGGILGVTKYAGTGAGADLEVVTHGIVDLLVKAAGTNIARGDAIAIHGTTGYGKKSDLTNAKHVLGYALEPATADDVMISVRISPFSTPSA